MSRNFRAILLFSAIVVLMSACSDVGEMDAAEARIAELEQELFDATSTTTSPLAITTATTTTTTTTTTLPEVVGVDVFEYFDFPFIASGQYADSGIPGLLVALGQSAFVGAISEGGSDCDAVDQSSIKVAGTMGEWALQAWYEAVLLWGQPTTVESFERCLPVGRSALNGWWSESWQEAVASVG